MTDSNSSAQQTSRWGEYLGQVWQKWRGLFLFFVLLIFVRATIVDWNHVPTRSMVPSIVPGDRIFVDKTAFGLRLPYSAAPILRWGRPLRSEIVVFHAPKTGILTVKRIIGLPGDTVSWRNSELLVNGEAARYSLLPDTERDPILTLQFPHTRSLNEQISGQEREILRYKISPKKSHGSFETVVVPSSYYLVLGDNRDNSADYRAFGFVHADEMVGRAKGVLFSLDPESFYAPRWHRFGSTF